MVLAKSEPLPFRGAVGVGAIHGRWRLGHVRTPDPSPEGEGREEGISL